MHRPSPPAGAARDFRFARSTTRVLAISVLALGATALVFTGVDALAAPNAAPPGGPIEITVADIHAAPEGAATLQQWHAAAREAITRQRPNQQAALRLLAYLALAQHRAAEALAARPASEAAWQALFDRVSAQTLSALMPAEAIVFTQLAETHAAARRSSTPTPDLQPAEALADRAARDVLARAATDGFDAEWKGAPPTDAAAWHSQLQPARPPHLPMLGRMKPIFVAAGDALRPPAPPPVDSVAFKEALAEVKARSQGGDKAALERARRWEMVTGSLVAGFWDETTGRLAARHALSGRQTSRVMAATLGATLDANIACHDAKYTYWTPRPSQADPTLRPVVGLPNHPSYPSNHACDSGAAAEVLGSFFPSEREAMQAMARDAGESRIDGGIHYRFDLDAGLDIGRAAARAALQALGQVTVAQP